MMVKPVIRPQFLTAIMVPKIWTKKPVLSASEVIRSMQMFLLVRIKPTSYITMKI